MNYTQKNLYKSIQLYAFSEIIAIGNTKKVTFLLILQEKSLKKLWSLHLIFGATLDIQIEFHILKRIQLFVQKPIVTNLIFIFYTLLLIGIINNNFVKK